MKIDHTGFCMGQFDTDVCGDCPTLKECFLLYIREHTLEVLKALNLPKKGD